MPPQHQPQLHEYDPDLDPPRPGPSGYGPPPFLPQEYQRLVANPFLALLGLILWVALMKQALAARRLGLVGLVLPGLIAVVYLLQYHCLDCGSTGLLFRWKRHACERVRLRQQADQVRRFRGPNPTSQTVLWAYVLTGMAILVGAVLMALRG